MTRYLPAGVGVALALMAALGASAQPPNLEQRYITTRDGDIDKLKRADKAKKLDDAMLKDADRMLADLQAQLQKILGPLDLKGFPAAGKLNFDTLLYSDVGFGALDGLLFENADDKNHVVATTQPLFMRWLRAHQNWWDSNNVPSDPAATVKSESFYTQAISSDAAVVRFTDLPLTKGDGATLVYAMLGARTQDLVPPVPDEIFIAAVQGGRMFIAWADVATKFDQIPACDAVRADNDKKVEQAYAAYQASGLKDQKAFDRSTALREQGDLAFRRCFGQQASKQDAFAAAVKQAQALYDRLPLK